MANMTLLEWAKLRDPDGSCAVVAELLSQTNEILTDCTFVEANLPTGHRVTIRTGLPTVYWRLLNQGIATSKSATAQVDETIGMLEARSEVDIDLISLNDDEAATRLSEARSFIEAMNQEMADTMFYGNTAVDPEQFLGLSPRYSSLSAQNNQNILDAAGNTANEQTSVWLICWSPETVFCTFPKGSKAGLLQEDLGRQTSYDTGTSGERMEVLVDRYQWKCGLVVKDWRYAVRIANISTDAADDDNIVDLDGLMDPKKSAAPYGDIIHLMAKAIARIPNLRMGRPAFYCNRTVFTGLMRSALEKSNSALSIQNALTQFGTNENMLSFLGIPVRQCDSILNTEAEVTT